MEVIINYLDNMFASLPKTEAIQQIKSDLLASMEEKYTELKKKGYPRMKRSVLLFPNSAAWMN